MSKTTAIETSHEDMIHDAQLDYYGKRLATCSSDRTIKVFDLSSPTTAGGAAGAGQKSVAQVKNNAPAHTLTSHTGPVWQVAWAHPKYGSILASCSYDGKVLIWKESTPAAGAAGKWTTIKEHTLHSASVNSIAWAPHELGAILACASSDGRVSVLTFKNDGTWDASLFTAHATGCNSISWSPSVLPGSLITPSFRGNAGSAAPPAVQRFITAGSDNLLKIWTLNANSAVSPTGSFTTPGMAASPNPGSNSTWILEETLDGHGDWVRDVAWAPNVGLPRSYIASCGQDRNVFVWTRDGDGKKWERVALDASSLEGNSKSEGGKFPSVVWRVSWSLAGNILAVSCADGKVSLWKENLRGVWECVSAMDG